MSPARRSTLLSPTRAVLGAALFGVIVFGLAQTIAGRAGNRAEVVMILDQDLVEWPYHDSIRQEAIGRLESSDASAAVLADVGGEAATLDGEMLSGQSHFAFTVDSSDSDRSVAAADALAQWLTETSRTERAAPLTESVEALGEQEAGLQEDLDALERLVGDGPSTEWSSEQVLAAARYEELARQLAQTERERRQAQNAIDALRPQLRPAGPAQPVGSPLSPLTTGLAGAAAALGALAFLRPDER